MSKFSAEVKSLNLRRPKSDQSLENGFDPKTEIERILKNKEHHNLS